MNGDEVRRLVSAHVFGGEDRAAVEELLGRVAAELDAGRPVAQLIEDAAVPLLLSAGPQDQGACRPGPAERAASARHEASADRAEKAYARECEEACRDFGAQPGTRLGLVQMGPGRWELLTADRGALVSLRAVPARTLDRDGRTYRLSRVKAAQWPAVAAEVGDMRTGEEAARRRWGSAVRPDRGLKSLADQTGPPVLYTGGRHFNRVPSGYVQFPGRRWLWFPVTGTSRSNAIMTAVDQAGRQVARYMIGDWRTIDITVHPDQRLTDELVLTLALTARWVSTFFDSWGEGG